MDVLTRFKEFEKELKKNPYLTVKRCHGRHSIHVTPKDGSPTGSLAIVYLENDLKNSLYPSFSFKSLTPKAGLEIELKYIKNEKEI